jgi:hypothetical protein
MKLKFKPGACFVGKTPPPASDNQNPAVIAEQARQAIPKRDDKAESPRPGRPLSAAEMAKVFQEFAVEFQREFFPTRTNSNGTLNFVVHPDRLSGFGPRLLARYGLKFVDVS